MRITRMNILETIVGVVVLFTLTFVLGYALLDTIPEPAAPTTTPTVIDLPPLNLDEQQPYVYYDDSKGTQ